MDDQVTRVLPLAVVGVKRWSGVEWSAGLWNPHRSRVVGRRVWAVWPSLAAVPFGNHVVVAGPKNLVRRYAVAAENAILCLDAAWLPEVSDEQLTPPVLRAGGWSEMRTTSTSSAGVVAAAAAGDDDNNGVP